MQLKNNIYKILQALSLDVVIGAGIFSLAISKYYHAKVSWSALLCQSIAIWLIYTFDHLLDAKKITGNPSTYRHQFHKKNKKILLITCFILSVFGIVSLYYLPVIILRAGLIALSLVFIYFFISHKLFFWSKEICVSVLYTFGIFIGPVCLAESSLLFIQYILIFQVFLMVFANLLLFSWFDILKDKQDGHTSMVIHFGKDKAEILLKSVLTTGTVLNLTLLFLHIDKASFIIQLVLLVMHSLLIILFKKDSLFRENDFYRVIGDGIFFIPIFFLLYNAIR